jgi:hypothetical protein
VLESNGKTGEKHAMRSTLIGILVLAFAWSAMAQEPSTASQTFAVPVPVKAAIGPAVEIEGPEVVTPGQPVQFNVVGIDQADLAKTRVVYFPREGVMCVPAQTWAGNSIVWFIPGNAPKYLIALAAPNGYDEIIVTTEGAPPPPVPPDPIPPPTPGHRMVMVVYESGDLTTDLSQQFEELREYAEDEEKIRRMRFLDKDMVDPDGKTPEWFKGYLDLIAAKQIKLPALMIGVLSSTPGQPLVALYVEPLPDTAEEAILTIKKYGG